MKYVIEYHEILSDHILATPEFFKEEIVEAETKKDLNNYISTKRDLYGNKYRQEKKYGFTHISNQGALKVYPLKVKKIKKV